MKHVYVHRKGKNVSRIIDGCFLGQFWAWSCMKGFWKFSPHFKGLCCHSSWIRSVNLRKQHGCRCLLLIKWSWFLVPLEWRGLVTFFLPCAMTEQAGRTGRLSVLGPRPSFPQITFHNCISVDAVIEPASKYFPNQFVLSHFTWEMNYSQMYLPVLRSSAWPGGSLCHPPSHLSVR